MQCLSPKAVMMAQTLRKSSLFSDLPQASLDQLLPGCELVRAEKGEYLFHEGEKAEGLYVVHRGGINVHRVTEDGKEQVIRVFYAGESFAEVVLVGDQSYPASAKASEASQVILLRTSFLRQAISGNPDLALRILGSMSLHLKFLVETVEDLKLKQAESRVSQWLIRKLQEANPSGEMPFTYELPSAKHLLASQLGVTSETLSRVFARFRKEGILEVKGKEITFQNSENLRRYFELPE